MAAVLIPLAIAGASTAIQLLLAPKVKQQPVDKGKFDDIRITGSDYGAFIPRVWGTARIGGNIIFSSGIDHQVINTPGSGGKGVPSTPPTRTHIYRTDAGVLFSRGQLSSFNRLWADMDVLFSASTPGDSATVEAEDATATGTVSVVSGGAVPNRATDQYVSSIDASEYLTFTVPISLPVAPPEPQVPEPYTYAIIYYKCSTPLSVELSANSGAWSETRTFFPASDGGWTSTFVEIDVAATSFKYGGQSGNASPDIDFIEFQTFYRNVPDRFRPSYVITGIKNPDISYPPDELYPIAAYNYVPSADGNGKASLTTSAGQSIRYYLGTSAQTADSSLTAWLDTRFPPSGGSTRAPAFRDLAYIVFDNYVLKNGRLPNFTAEVTDATTASAANIVQEILTEVGLTSSNWNTTTGASLTTTGYIETSQATRRAVLEPMLRWHQLALAEIDGKVTIVSDGTVTSSYTVVPDTDLRAHPYGSDAPPMDAHIVKREETQIPKQVRVSFMNPALEYHNETVVSDPIYTTSATETKEFTFPVISDASTAQVVANRLHAHEIIRDKGITIEAMPSMAKYCVGDVVTLTIDGRAYELQIARKTVQIPVGVIKFECLAHDKAVMSALGSDLKDLSAEIPPVPNSLLALNTITTPANTKLLTVQNNYLFEKNKGQLGLYVAASRVGVGDWENAALYKEFGDDNYELVSVLDSPSPMGVATTTSDGTNDTSTQDTTSSLTVNFYDDVEFESLTEAELSEWPRANLLWIENGLEGGEFIQFRTASENSLDPESPYKSSWTFTNLWRGRFSYNPVVAFGGTAVGADVFAVNESLKFVPLENSAIGETVRLKGVTNGQTVDDALAYSTTVTNSYGWDVITAFGDTYTTTGTSSENILSLTAGQQFKHWQQKGDAMVFEFAGTFAANTNQKVVGVRVGTTDHDVIDTTQNGGAWRIHCTILTPDRYDMKVIVQGLTDTSGENGVAHGTPTVGTGLSVNPPSVHLRARTPTQAGDVTCTFARAIYEPVDLRRYESVVTVGGIAVTIAGEEVTV